jgi:TolB-like protein
MNIWVIIRSRISEDQLVSIKSYLLKADDSETLELPNKPSIAVLPFENMSGDPDQDYFSDGLTEQIIMGFSKVPIL